MPLYNLRTTPTGFAMGKFDPDLNVEASYNLTPKGHGYTCDCPAGARAVKLKPCKHQRMIPFMLGAVNTERFYDPETRTWSEPLAGLRAGDTDGLPEGMTDVSLNDPITLHNTVATAVNEPIIRRR